jgi:HAMP domain-containing protein
VLLAAVLAGFGFTAWRLERATRLQRVDQELERSVAGVEDAVRRGGQRPDRAREDRPPGRPGEQDRPQDRAPDARELDRQPPDGLGALGDARPQPPGQFGPPDDRRPPADRRPRDRPPQNRLFAFAPDAAFYSVAWDAGGAEVYRSASAPAVAPRPARGSAEREARLRGTLREYIHFTSTGDVVLVGRDIREELTGMRRFGWLLAGFGSAVFAFGLAGGWWISTRALRPTGTISETAARIATGDLAQRIPVEGAGSELDDLAGVLNETFAR